MIDIEDFKDLMFAKWLEKAARRLRRIPEYGWLFRDGAPDWLTVEQVAERMVVPKRTVYTWCRQIIGVRLGEGKAGYRIPRSGLIIFLADLDQEAPPEPSAEEVEQTLAILDGRMRPPEPEEPPNDRDIASFDEYAGVSGAANGATTGGGEGEE